MTLAVGDRVRHTEFRGYKSGVFVEGCHNGFSQVIWAGETHPSTHYTSNLELLESSAQESEDTVVQKFNHNDQVVSADGNLFGTVLGEAKRDNKGTHYKVVWEDGAETINLASTLTPVRASQKLAAELALTKEEVVQEEQFDTEAFHLLETLGWGEAALKADIFKLVTSMDRNGHKLQDAKELVEASKALVAMLERSTSK